MFRRLNGVLINLNGDSTFILDILFYYYLFARSKSISWLASVHSFGVPLGFMMFINLLDFSLVIDAFI